MSALLLARRLSLLLECWLAVRFLFLPLQVWLPLEVLEFFMVLLGLGMLLNKKIPMAHLAECVRV